MEEFGSLVVGLVLLILLAVTSMRYGVDSRDGFRSRRSEFTPLGIVWDVPAAAPKPTAPPAVRENQRVQRPQDCALAPCGP